MYTKYNFCYMNQLGDDEIESEYASVRNGSAYRSVTLLMGRINDSHFAYLDLRGDAVACSFVVEVLAYDKVNESYECVSNYRKAEDRRVTVKDMQKIFEETVGNIIDTNNHLIALIDNA